MIAWILAGAGALYLLNNTGNKPILSSGKLPVPEVKATYVTRNELWITVNGQEIKSDFMSYGDKMATVSPYDIRISKHIEGGVQLGYQIAVESFDGVPVMPIINVPLPF